MKSYGIKEWFVFAVGAVAVGYQLYAYMVKDLEGTLLDGIVFAASMLLMFAPKTMVSIVGKRLGKNE